MSKDISQNTINPQERRISLSKLLVLLYVVICYFIFLGTFLYAIGFVGNIAVPKSIDSVESSPVGPALLINTLLLGLFAVQHSVMARQGFKKMWIKIVPKSIERSTYVLFASSALILLFWQWHPLPDIIWSVNNSLVYYLLMDLFSIGWFIVLAGTFMVNHFDLFGLRQVYLYNRSKKYTELGFRTTALYKYMRHPIMLGFIIAFWATPTMMLGHLIFSIATTGYILIAVQIEEKDLTKIFGDDYRRYKENVAGFIPSKKYEAKPRYKVNEQSEIL